MPKFNVTVKYYREYSTGLTIYADEEDEAEEKALDIVTGWSGVSDEAAPEVTDTEEE